MVPLNKVILPEQSKAKGLEKALNKTYYFKIFDEKLENFTLKESID